MHLLFAFREIFSHAHTWGPSCSLMNVDNTGSRLYVIIYGNEKFWNILRPLAEIDSSKKGIMVFFGYDAR